MATMPIVAGVDGSEESLRAVEWAALEARRHRAPLRIVSAPALLPRTSTHPQDLETVATRLEGESCRALDEAVTRSREVAPGQLIDVDLLTGPPAVAVAQSGAGALMLVVGARGAGGMAAMLLGSVSRYAAMQARCPVVVVREETSAVHREVVVGIRDPQDADDTLGYAFDEAALRGATLIAVHSWNWPCSVPSRRVGRGAAPGQPPTRGSWRRRATGALPRPWRRGGTSIPRCRSGRTWCTTTPRTCSPATRPVPTSSSSAGTARPVPAP